MPSLESLSQYTLKQINSTPATIIIRKNPVNVYYSKMSLLSNALLLGTAYDIAINEVKFIQFGVKGLIVTLGLKLIRLIEVSCIRFLT